MPRRQKIANIEESTRHVHHPSPSATNNRTIEPIHIQRDNLTQPRSHRRHMAGAQTSITINGSYPTVNVHQVQELQHYHHRSKNHQQPSTRPSERIRCSSPYTIAIPSVLCTESDRPCTNKNEGDGQPSYISCILKK